MIYGSLFSGIEAASCAWLPLGWTCAWVAEIDPFASAVLRHHYPDVPNLGDITKVDWHAVEPVDIVIGGPPCQDFSVAGNRAGHTGSRGNLSLAYVRALDAIDPAWSVTENVPGWLSMGDNSFGRFLAAMVGSGAPLIPRRGQRWTDAGLVAGPKRTAAWRVLDAQFHGVPQRRRRVFVLAVRGAGNWACADALFPQRQSVPRNFAPRREAGEDAASGAGDGFAYGVKSRNGGGCTWGGEGADNLIAIDGQNAAAVGDLCGTIQGEGAARHNRAPMVAFGGNNTAGTGRGTPLVCGTIGAENTWHTTGQENQAALLLPTGMSVRRLTPRECLRLQGFPDDYLDIQHRGKPAADGPKYRATGNSFAVPVVRYIGRRIQAFEEATS